MMMEHPGERDRAIRHVEAHCDYLVQDYVRVLCEDNARLKEELSRVTLADRARSILARLDRVFTS